MARRPRTLIAAAATGLALAGALVTAPGASAVSSTITLTATGALSVAEPTTTVNLGSTASTVGAWTSGSFGTVTVTDARTGLLANTWTASVTVSDFTMQSPPAGATTAQKTIAAAGMVYNMGTATAASGNPTGALFVPATATAIVAAATALPVGAMTALGTNGESWNPTLTVALTNQIAGTYAGTIVHSIA